MEQIADFKLLLDTAVLAGYIMLSNGAEIYRVEDTINRILKVSEFKTTETYATATGLFVTLDDPKCDSMTVIKRINERGTDLNKISLVNTISRKFCAGEISLKDAFHDLKNIKGKQYSLWQRDLGIICAAASFTILLGGNGIEAIGAGIDGLLLVLVLRLSDKVCMNSFMRTFIGSAAIAVGSVLLVQVPIDGISMDHIISGSIMPMVPGAAFTTAIRDTLQGDYVAGSAKALEALVKAVAIALGVGFGIILMRGVRI